MSSRCLLRGKMSESMNTEQEEFRVNLTTCLSSTKHKLVSLEDTVRDIDNTKALLSMKLDIAIADIDNTFEHYCRLLECLHADFKKGVQSLASDRSAKLETCRQSVSDAISEITGVCQAVDEVLQVGNEHTLQKNYTDWMTRLEQLSSSNNAYMTEEYKLCFIPNSFNLRMEDIGFIQQSSLDPRKAQLKMSADGCVGLTGIEETLVIESHSDSVNNGCELIKVKVTDPCGKELSVDIIDKKDRTYTISYTPVMAGRHTVDVQIYGQSIKHCPFSVDIQGNDNESSSNNNAELNGKSSIKDCSLSVDIQDQGNGIESSINNNQELNGKSSIKHCSFSVDIQDKGTAVESSSNSNPKLHYKSSIKHVPSSVVVQDQDNGVEFACNSNQELDEKSTSSTCHKSSQTIISHTSKHICSNWEHSTENISSGCLYGTSPFNATRKKVLYSAFALDRYPILKGHRRTSLLLDKKRLKCLFKSGVLRAHQGGFVRGEGLAEVSNVRMSPTSTNRAVSFTPDFVNRDVMVNNSLDGKPLSILKAVNSSLDGFGVGMDKSLSQCFELSSRSDIRDVKSLSSKEANLSSDKCDPIIDKSLSVCGEASSDKRDAMIDKSLSLCTEASSHSGIWDAKSLSVVNAVNSSSDGCDAPTEKSLSVCTAVGFSSDNQDAMIDKSLSLCTAVSSNSDNHDAMINASLSECTRECSNSDSEGEHTQGKCFSSPVPPRRGQRKQLVIDGKPLRRPLVHIDQVVPCTQQKHSTMYDMGTFKTEPLWSDSETLFGDDDDADSEETLTKLVSRDDQSSKVCNSTRVGAHVDDSPERKDVKDSFNNADDKSLSLGTYQTTRSVFRFTGTHANTSCQNKSKPASDDTVIPLLNSAVNFLESSGKHDDADMFNLKSAILNSTKHALDRGESSLNSKHGILGEGGSPDVKQGRPGETSLDMKQAGGDGIHITTWGRKKITADVDMQAGGDGIHNTIWGRKNLKADVDMQDSGDGTHDTTSGRKNLKADVDMQDSGDGTHATTLGRKNLKADVDMQDSGDGTHVTTLGRKNLKADVDMQDSGDGTHATTLGRKNLKADVDMQGSGDWTHDTTFGRKNLKADVDMQDSGDGTHATTLGRKNLNPDIDMQAGWDVTRHTAESPCVQSSVQVDDVGVWELDQGNKDTQRAKGNDCMEPAHKKAVISNTGDVIQFYRDTHCTGKRLVGNLVFQIGHPGVGSLSFPLGVTCVPLSGNIVVCDNGNDAVKIYSSTGKHLLTIGNRFFRRPSAVIADSCGNMFVKDSVQIQKFDKNGKHLLEFGRGILKSPFGLSFTSKGDILTVDAAKPSINIFSQDGTVVKCVVLSVLGESRTGSKIRFLAVHENRIILTDLGRSVVYMADFNGHLVKKIGRYGNGPGCFCEPSGVCADRHGNILIADSKNNRIQVFTSQGIFVSCIFCSNGIVRPSDIHVTPDGLLLVSNFLQHCVKVFRLSCK